MKPNEVMIGDWLWFTDPDTQETDPVQIEKDDIGYDSEEFWQCFSPIEITPEILEANGFENYKNIGSIRYFRKDGVKYEVHQGLLYFNRGEIQGIEYVHEMQHALRLIGHDDLADNFKIEKGGNQ